MEPQGAPKTGSQARSRIRETRRILVERYPNCFMKKGEIKLPLMKNVHLALIAANPDLPSKDIRKAVRDYVRGPSYLISIRNLQPRYDLDGRQRGHCYLSCETHAQKSLAAMGNKLPKRFKPYLKAASSTHDLKVAA